MKLLVLGATGLVGSHVLRLALADKRIDSIVAPVRKPLTPHPKLEAPLVDFENLPGEAAWWNADAAICAMGTTIKVAGSKEAFERIDKDYPIMAAGLARRHGTRAMALVTAHGADPSSRLFYFRVKGQIEKAFSDLAFNSLTLVRPSFIGGERKERRMGEGLGLRITKALGPLLPRNLRINPAEKIAQAMLEAVLVQKPGQTVISSDQLI